MEVDKFDRFWCGRVPLSMHTHDTAEVREQNRFLIKRTNPKQMAGILSLLLFFSLPHNSINDYAVAKKKCDTMHRASIAELGANVSCGGRSTGAGDRRSDSSAFHQQIEHFRGGNADHQ
jgi:hypothetical protein